MKYIITTLAALAFCGGIFVHAADAPAYKPEAGSKTENSKKVNWAFKPDPALPNVLILGDSISIGYTLKVRELLKGMANVFRPVSTNGETAVNCQGTTFSLTQIDSWLAGRKWSVIHFNWGLHDLKHVTEAGTGTKSRQATDPYQATVEEYSRNLETLVGKLKATGAQLIFATTTPVPPHASGPLREVDAPARYNAAAVKIMKAHGIAVNDLFTLVQPQLEKLQSPKNVHFKAEGSAALAKQVAGAIEAALPKSGDQRQAR